MRFTCLLFGLAVGSAYGQEFEVASLRPSPTPHGAAVGCRGGPGTGDPGLFVCSNQTLANLVALAYRIDFSQLSTPAWLTDPALVFDLQARVPQGTTTERFSMMFQKLLVDRFKLAIRRETRETQQYDLVVAKGGPKFLGVAALAKNRCPALPSGQNMTVANGQYVLHIPEMSMEVLSAQLAYLLHTHVRDATGLTGNFDIAMCWTPEPNGIPTSPGTGPTLQQALPEQLGLRLESKKGPVEFIVVEHAEKLPTEN